MNDPDRAQKLMRERQSLLDSVNSYKSMAQDLQDNIDLIELGEMEEDEEVVADAETSLKALVKKAPLPNWKRCWTARPTATTPSLRSTRARAARKSCDWASMLARMYVRWAEKHGYKVELQSESAGEEAGIKSAAYKISGHNAYGWLKSEAACTVWCGFRLMTRQPSATRPLARSGSIRGRRQYRDRGEPLGHSHRHVSFVRRGWSAREHDGLGCADYPHPDGDRHDQLGKIAAPEP